MTDNEKDKTRRGQRKKAWMATGAKVGKGETKLGRERAFFKDVAQETAARWEAEHGPPQPTNAVYAGLLAMLLATGSLAFMHALNEMQARGLDGPDWIQKLPDGPLDKLATVLVPELLEAHLRAALDDITAKRVTYNALTAENITDAIEQTAVEMRVISTNIDGALQEIDRRLGRSRERAHERAEKDKNTGPAPAEAASDGVTSTAARLDRQPDQAGQRPCAQLPEAQNLGKVPRRA